MINVVTILCPSVNGGGTIFIFSGIHCGEETGGNFCSDVSLVKLLYLINDFFDDFVLNFRPMLPAIKPVAIPSVKDDAAAPANKLIIQTAINVVFILSRIIVLSNTYYNKKFCIQFSNT